MQYAFPQGRHGYQQFRGSRQGARQPHEYYYFPPPPPPPPPSTNYYTPNNHGYNYSLPYFPAGPPNYFNSGFPGHSVNAGGNWHVGHGIQRNGDVKIGYGSNAKLNNGEIKRKKRKSTIIGGCHGNQGGHQTSGDVILGDIH
ncbi:Vacuolar protein-sorting protein bro1 [Bienertia sinuspersici]